MGGSTGFDFKQKAQAAVPIGGVIPITSGANLVTDGAFEYLKTGVLKSAEGYQNSLATNPELGVNVGTSVYSASTNSPVVGAWYAGSTYYINVNGSILSSSTPSSFSAVATANGYYDCFSFGNVLVAMNGTAAWYVSGSTATQIASAAYVCGAANSAGTLATVINDPSQGYQAYTSTNGTTWTSRATSGHSSGVKPILITWSPCANAFILLGGNLHAYTSTDGYTFTNRATLATMSGSTHYPNLGNGHYAASSSTTTLISFATGTAGYAAIAKTTDGVNYTVTEANAFFGTNSIISYLHLPKLFYIDGVFYAMSSVGYFNNVGQPALCMKSTDDGATRQPFAQPLWPGRPHAYGYSLWKANGIYFSGAQYNASGYLSGGAGCSVQTHATPFGQASHIGRPRASWTFSTAYNSSVGDSTTNYVRIK